MRRLPILDGGCLFSLMRTRPKSRNVPLGRLAMVHNHPSGAAVGGRLEALKDQRRRAIAGFSAGLTDVAADTRRADPRTAASLPDHRPLPAGAETTVLGARRPQQTVSQGV